MRLRLNARACLRAFHRKLIQPKKVDVRFFGGCRAAFDQRLHGVGHHRAQVVRATAVKVGHAFGRVAYPFVAALGMVGDDADRSQPNARPVISRVMRTLLNAVREARRAGR